MIAGQPIIQFVISIRVLEHTCAPSCISVIYYSPLQTLYWYDTPARMEEVPGTKFFDNIPVTFDDTKVIHDYIRGM